MTGITTEQWVRAVLLDVAEDVAAERGWQFVGEVIEPLGGVALRWALPNDRFFRMIVIERVAFCHRGGPGDYVRGKLLSRDLGGPNPREVA